MLALLDELASATARIEFVQLGAGTILNAGAVVNASRHFDQFMGTQLLSVLPGASAAVRG